MPRKILISDEDMTWLHEEHRHHSYPTMAKRLGCCVDTLKRILVREGLQDFDGAKYQVKRAHSQDTWTRPCINCKSTEERPRLQYMCGRCRRKAGYGD